MKKYKIASENVKYNNNHTVEFEIPIEMLSTCGTLQVEPKINKFGKYEFTLTLG